MAGLMDILSQPETWNWLGGVGAAMDRDARGQGFDLTNANAGLMQSLMDRRQSTELQGLMSGDDYTDQQRAFALRNPQAAEGFLGQQLFPQAGDPKRYQGR